MNGSVPGDGSPSASAPGPRQDDPHRDSPSARLGPDLADAGAAVILVHGRGDSARGILTLAPQLDVAMVTFIAPQAAGSSWYPQSFLAPFEMNEPWLTSALDRVGTAVTEATPGLPLDRTVLMGFSQGACLSLEFAARNPGRFGGVVAFSGGLIGPEGTSLSYEGSLEGTPVFLGCSDVDPHIPLARVNESARIMEALGGRVEERIYRGMAHTVNADELEWAHALLDELVGAPD